jgi:Integrase core domain
VRQWLMSNDVFTLHRPSRKRIPRNHYTVSNRFEQLEADLIELRSLSAHNDGCNYILVVIDCFSRFLWTKPLLNKTGKEIKAAFEQIFDQLGHKVLSIRTDAGKEFINNTVQSYLKEKDVQYIRTYDPSIKASIVERVNLTLKTKLWKYFSHENTQRYIEVLPKITAAYNHGYHRSLKMAPIEVTDDNIKTVYHNIHSQFASEKSKTKKIIKVGDFVRIVTEKTVFSKSYLENWSHEIFIVSRVIKHKPRIVYRLSDLQNEEILGQFYSEDLQIVTHDPYKMHYIDEILASRGRGVNKEVLVRWKGHIHKKHNTWIRASEIKHLLK